MAGDWSKFEAVELASNSALRKRSFILEVRYALGPDRAFFPSGSASANTTTAGLIASSQHSHISGVSDSSFSAVRTGWFRCRIAEFHRPVTTLSIPRLFSRYTVQLRPHACRQASYQTLFSGGQVGTIFAQQSTENGPRLSACQSQKLFGPPNFLGLVT